MDKEEYSNSLQKKTLFELKLMHEQVFKSAFKGNDREKIIDKLIKFYKSKLKDDKLESINETIDVSQNKATTLLQKIVGCFEKVNALKVEKHDVISEQKEDNERKHDELDSAIFKESDDKAKQVIEIQMSWSQVKQSIEVLEQSKKDFSAAIKDAKKELDNTMNNIQQQSFDFGKQL